jgi:endonuclease III
MAGTNRSGLITKLYKVLKQHYKPVSVNGDRPLLEQMLYACCLENAHYEKAEKTYQHLASSFFDWNEVRVSTVKELAESLKDLPNPAAAASNLKRLLQTVFEATYSFDLEPVKKQNLGVGIKRLEKMEGASQFVVGYVTQHGLGGHSIPLDGGAVEILYIVGIATEAERDSGEVAGLERAIPKNKGAEFASLLHQFSADFVSNPLSPNIKTLLLAVNADAKDRLPKRGQKKDVTMKPPELPPTMPVKAAGKGAKAEKVAHDKHGKDHKFAGKAAPKKEEVKDAKRPTGKAPIADTSKKHPAKKEAAKPVAKAGKPAHATHGRPAAPAARKAGTKHLAKRKPR